MKKRKQRGFSLIESVVTMAVLSFGLLGVASVQLTAMSQGRSSFERNQATLLANEMVEKIRANLPAAAAGNYDLSRGTHAGGSVSSCNGTGANCSAADMAAADLADWQRRVAALLNGAATEIQVDVSAGAANSVTLVLSWGDNQISLVAELS